MKTNRQKRSNNKSFAEIFGSHAVRAALKNPYRIHQKLFVSQNQRENLNNGVKKLVPEKMIDLNAIDLEGAMNMVKGSAVSMGMEVVK